MANLKLTIREQAIAFLFSRWLATHYEGRLNEENGYWYMDKMDYFQKEVLPNQIINGSFDNTVEFIMKQNEKDRNNI